VTDTVTRCRDLLCNFEKFSKHRFLQDAISYFNTLQVRNFTVW